MITYIYFDSVSKLLFYRLIIILKLLLIVRSDTPIVLSFKVYEIKLANWGVKMIIHQYSSSINWILHNY